MNIFWFPSLVCLSRVSGPKEQYYREFYSPLTPVCDVTLSASRSPFRGLSSATKSLRMPAAFVCSNPSSRQHYSSKQACKTARAPSRTHAHHVERHRDSGVDPSRTRAAAFCLTAAFSRHLLGVARKYFFFFRSFVLSHHHKTFFFCSFSLTSHNL